MTKLTQKKIKWIIKLKEDIINYFLKKILLGRNNGI